MSKEIRNSIFNLPEGVGGSGSSYWTSRFPAATEKDYSLLDSIDNTKYNWYSCLSHHPRLMNKVIMVYMETYEHTYDARGRVMIRISNDNGVTFGNTSVLYDPDEAGEYSVVAPFSGYSSDGRFHVLTTIRNAALDTYYLKHIYSDDNGVTFTVVDITDIVYDADYLYYSVTSKLIENNGVLMCGFYSSKTGNTATKKSVLRLVNGTWTIETIEITDAYENEVFIESLGGNNLIALVRSEVTTYWIQYSSSDNGLTWTRLGDITFNSPAGIGANFGSFGKFKMNCEDVIVFYFPRRGANKYLYAVYAKAEDLIDFGREGWNYNTLKVVWTLPATSTQVQAGNVLHYNQNYNAIGAWSNHISLTESDIYIFEIDTTNIATLEGLLFPVYSADADSNAFNAVVSTNPTAIVNLIGGLKQYSIYDKIKAAYPMLGGTAALHKFNLVNPIDSDEAFRLDFIDGAGTGWIHSTTGAKPDGVGTYADTHLTPTGTLELYSIHLAYYARSLVAEAKKDISVGQSGATSSFLQLATRVVATNASFYSNQTTQVVNGATSSGNIGLIVGSRTSNVISKIFYRGVQSGATYTTAALNRLPTSSILIAAGRWDVVTIDGFSTKECAFALIGDGLTDIDVHNLNRIIQYYQKALGRNV